MVSKNILQGLKWKNTWTIDLKVTVLMEVPLDHRSIKKFKFCNMHKIKRGRNLCNNKLAKIMPMGENKVGKKLDFTQDRQTRQPNNESRLE